MRTERDGQTVPPPLGEALRGTIPGQSLHIDFVTMVDKEGLLVLEDGFSAFVLLWWADEYSAATARQLL